MSKRLAALLVGMVTVCSSGCQASNETKFSLEECYEKDRRESEQLAREVGTLLTPPVRSTLANGSACDSAPEGGASITYIIGADIPLKPVLDKFYSAGWSNLPPSSQTCLCYQTCIAGIGKTMDDGRYITATVQNASIGRYMLEALFSKSAV
ncbi:hypothetical protein [Nonomuraea jiangxiensis]|uniref:hypothetical protein n=1 Tax=Nonomuraea jiangxiensis TaxID=633440 RepID=UPI00115FAD69|nr:hypothetical protein [Nonomuraea jiangxiensis]